MHATRCAGQGLLVRPTESELWETLDLPASQAGGGNTWIPPRIEGGPSTRHAHEQIVIFLPGRLLSFFGVFLFFFFFWRPQSGARPTVQCDAVWYGAHRSTGFTARFQPIDRGNRELGDHGKAQTLAGDWAVRARSSAGSIAGRMLWRRARPIARDCAVSVRVGDGAWYGVLWTATSNKQFPTAGGSGPGRQPSVLEVWRSSFVTCSCPPARPSGHRRCCW